MGYIGIIQRRMADSFDIAAVAAGERFKFQASSAVWVQNGKKTPLVIPWRLTLWSGDVATGQWDIHIDGGARTGLITGAATAFTLSLSLAASGLYVEYVTTGVPPAGTTVFAAIAPDVSGWRLI